MATASPVSAPCLRRCSTDLPVRPFPPCSFLLVAGRPARHVELLSGGHARVVAPGSEPGTGVAAAVVGPGHRLGIAALAGRATYHASDCALTRSRSWLCPPTRPSPSWPAPHA